MINNITEFKDIDPALPGPPTEASNGLKFVTANKTDLTNSIPKPQIPSIPDVPKPAIPSVPNIPSTPSIPTVSTPSLPNVSGLNTPTVPPLSTPPSIPSINTPQISSPNYNPKYFEPNNITGKTIS